MFTERIENMDFTHKENEIVLLSEEGGMLAQITFPYKGEDKTQWRSTTLLLTPPSAARESPESL